MRVHDERNEPHWRSNEPAQGRSCVHLVFVPVLAPKLLATCVKRLTDVDAVLGARRCEAADARG